MAKRNAGTAIMVRLLALAAGFALLMVASGLAETYHHTLSWSQADLGFSTKGGFDLVDLPGSRWLNRPGEPQLPVVPVRIALPGGCIVEDLEITCADTIALSGQFLLWPVQPPQSLSSTRPSQFVAPLTEIYTSDEMYPECPGELVGWGRLRGSTICDILVFPLAYLPLQRRLILYRELTLVISYSSDEAVGETGYRDCGLVTRLAANPGETWGLNEHRMHDGSPMVLEAETVTYLIITCDSLAPYFEPLRSWKHRKGLPAEIVTVEAIEGTYPGIDLQEKIRNCIIDHKATAGTDWVLLGGDIQIIPDRKAYVDLSDRKYLPCDLYYSDLDGDWNADGDLYWGEIPSDDVNLYADVFVGRAPVVTGSEAAIFVDKVLTYEGVYGGAHECELDMLFVGEILWGDPGDPSDPDYTDAGIAKDLVDTRYVPERFDISRLYESQGTLDHDAFMSEINQGRGIINLLCHGQYGSISLAADRVQSSDFASATNGPSYGLIYSASCLSGGFDQNDCIGEVWVLSQEGGGFFIGNSRYGWNCPGFPGEGPSDYYDQAFFESVFLTGFTNLGKAHADAKHEYVAESRADPYMRYVLYGLNLFGDPESPLWTDTPSAMEVACPNVVEAGPQVFGVGVASGGSPVPGAVVCLLKGDEIYFAEETDGAGNVSLFINPASPGTLLVTVTKQNHLPFVGQARIIGGSAPGAPDEVAAEEILGPAVELRWSRVADPDLACYKIYRNTVPVPEGLATVAPWETVYVDNEVVEGTLYYYWITSVDSSGGEGGFSEVCSLMVAGAIGVFPPEAEDGLTVRVTPNPFAHKVSLVTTMRSGADLCVQVFDVKGRWICDLSPETGDGRHGASWDARDAYGRRVRPGIYLVRFSHGGRGATHKVVLIE
jgi:hypothetical protein